MLLKMGVRICPSFWYFGDSSSPCKYPLHGPNLAQKPLYLVGTVIKLKHQGKFERAPKSCQTT